MVLDLNKGKEIRLHPDHNSQVPDISETIYKTKTKTNKKQNETKQYPDHNSQVPDISKTIYKTKTHKKLKQKFS